MRYDVSYDLHKPEQRYEELWEALRHLHGHRVLLSQWRIEVSGWNADQILQSLRQHLDDDDRMAVNCLDNDDHASFNLMKPPVLSLMQRAMLLSHARPTRTLGESMLVPLQSDNS